MKSYSNDSVTAADLANVTGEVQRTVNQAISEVDVKQTRQIMLLRWAVGLSFAVNAALTLILHLA